MAKPSKILSGLRINLPITLCSVSYSRLQNSYISVEMAVVLKYIHICVSFQMIVFTFKLLAYIVIHIDNDNCPAITCNVEEGQD